MLIIRKLEEAVGRAACLHGERFWVVLLLGGLVWLQRELAWVCRLGKVGSAADQPQGVARPGGISYLRFAQNSPQITFGLEL